MNIKCPYLVFERFRQDGATFYLFSVVCHFLIRSRDRIYSSIWRRLTSESLNLKKLDGRLLIKVNPLLYEHEKSQPFISTKATVINFYPFRASFYGFFSPNTVDEVHFDHLFPMYTSTPINRI